MLVYRLWAGHFFFVHAFLYVNDHNKLFNEMHNYQKNRALTLFHFPRIIGPRQANLVLIAYASSEGSGEPAHPRSLARTFAARSYKQ